MPISIHGKSYKTVAERLEEAHSASDLLGIETEVLYLDPQIMVKATIKTKKGVFTGISAADPNKSIEAKTPVEVAETSAVGRALAFAGYAGSEIASADEMVKAGVYPQSNPQPQPELDHAEKQLVAQPCRKCGGEMVKNPKTGKIFCKAKCWLDDNNNYGTYGMEGIDAAK